MSRQKKTFNLITKNKSNEINYNTDEDIYQKSIKEKLTIGEPLKFDENESHSFSEWLTLLNIKKIKREKTKKM